MSTTLLVTELFPPKTGGSSRWFWEIYQRLPARAVVIAAGEDPRQADFDQTHKLRLYRVPLSLPNWGVRSLRALGNYWRAGRALRKIVRAEGVTELHCGRCLPEGWLAYVLNRLYGLPYSCYVHGEEMNYATSSRELSWMAQRVVASAKRLIANSRNTERILREDWRAPAERVHVLHPGVDTERFRPALPDAAVRARLGWTDRTVILTAGRLQRRKGQDHMMLALGEIRRAIPNVLYCVVGDGEERQALGQLAATAGVDQHVQFLGEIGDAELIDCYQQCDLFALPNRQIGQDIEGFGMVLLEAQACGRPVLAGASGGTAETMRISDTGVVVPCETPHELARAVIDLLTAPARLARMGAAARHWVVERFDWAALSSQAAALFGVPCGDTRSGDSGFRNGEAEVVSAITNG